MTTCAEMVTNGRELFTERRHASQRRAVRTPVSVTIVAPDNSVLAWGRAELRETSATGLRVSGLQFHWGRLPLGGDHFMVIVPSVAELRDRWIKARPVHLRFDADGAEIGAQIVLMSEDARSIVA